MSQSDLPRPSAPDARPLAATPPAPPRRGANWPARFVGALIGLLAIGASYVVAVAFLPRWWAQRIGQLSDGRFTTGIGAGLVVGSVFTVLPLLCLAGILRRGRAWRTRGALLLLAVLLAVPNLITLGIVYGTGNAAHAGERTLDVDAPGFRGASLVGAIAGVVLVVLLVSLVAGRRRRKRQIAQLKEQLAEREVVTGEGRHAASILDTKPTRADDRKAD